MAAPASSAELTESMLAAPWNANGDGDATVVLLLNPVDGAATPATAATEGATTTLLV